MKPQRGWAVWLFCFDFPNTSSSETMFHNRKVPSQIFAPCEIFKQDVLLRANHNLLLYVRTVCHFVDMGLRGTKRPSRETAEMFPLLMSRRAQEDRCLPENNQVHTVAADESCLRARSREEVTQFLRQAAITLYNRFLFLMLWAAQTK